MLNRPTAPDPSPCVSRRVLLAAAGAGLIGLGGCSTDAPAHQPDDSGSVDGGPAAVPPTAPPSSTVQQALTTTAEVPVGGGKVVAGMLVVQPTSGQFTAFDVRCPHRGAPVSPPQAGVITCFEHGSTFRDVDGALLGGPAPRGLKQIPIVVNGGTITTA